ncbi:MAG: hypothetical protein L0Z50_31925, partial [Verrucomicrobiales bacterium]|nr:hypothetical protein [Verrucomicrobiales bacterium]
MKHNRNGDGHVIEAQWVNPTTRQIPPRAFVIPPGELNVAVLKTSPDGGEGIAAVRNYVVSQLSARYGAAVRGLEADCETAREWLQSLHKEREILAAEVAKMPRLIPEARPILIIPHGIEGVWTVALMLLAIMLVGFEWVNAAGFAARYETHDLALAMSFTVLFALVPLALKFGLARMSASLARFADITVALV